MVEQGEGVRHQNRRAHALRRPGADQQRRRRRERAGQRRGGKKREPRHEHSFGADTVAERAGGENQGRKGDRIGGHHPLQFGHAAAQRTAHAAQSRVDDGHVELNDPKSQTHCGERQRTSPRGAIVPRAADGGSDGASWRRLRLQLRRERLHGLNDPSGKEQAYNHAGATRLRERAPRPLSAAAFPRPLCGFQPA